jgi:hypothetical protein
VRHNKQQVAKMHHHKPTCKGLSAQCRACSFVASKLPGTSTPIPVVIVTKSTESIRKSWDADINFVEAAGTAGDGDCASTLIE